jgi:hypothetical protein
MFQQRKKLFPLSGAIQKNHLVTSLFQDGGDVENG